MAVNVVQGGNPVEDIQGFDGATGIIQSAVLVKEGTDSPIPSSVTRGLVVDTSGSGLSSFRTTITTAGTPAALSTLTCKAVFVVALPTNTQRVAVGGSTVDAADSTFNGIPLEPLQGVSIEVNNADDIYLDVLGNGHGVSWTPLGF